MCAEVLSLFRQKPSTFISIDTYGKNENYPIDLVYLWCEDNPQREKLRNEWKEKLGIMTNKKTNSLEATSKGRFVSNDELKYSLRSVEKYASWINKIYIITDNQVPEWLNLNHPKIKIVDHKEIMPDSARPNFNSNAIEHCIPDIKGLNEHFLYANDDMLFGNYVKPEDFFKDGRPIYILGRKVLGLKKSIYIKAIGTLDVIKSIYTKTIISTYNLVKNKFGSNKNLRYLLRDPHHNIDPYLKSTMLKTKEAFKEEIDATINSHFRSETDVQRIIYVFYALINNEAYYKLQSFMKTRISRYFGMRKISNVKKVLDNAKYKMFCINDGEDVTDVERKKYKNVMEEIFPEKSSFEK